MMNSNPLLKILFDGSAVGPGRIPVGHLLRFLTHMTKALQRAGRVLQGRGESARRGRQPQSVKDELSLDLVMLTHGSPSAVLGFDRHQKQEMLPGIPDVGLEILEKTLVGLGNIQEGEETLPVGYDTGVLMAWRDAGGVFNQGISRIEFTLNLREKPLRTTFTPQGFTRLQERIKGHQTNIRTIEGRLLMADFKEHGTRCRVHPSAGEPVLCLFDEEQKDEVLDDMLHYVRIVGEAKEDHDTGKIVSIKIKDIERLEDQEDKAQDLLPQGTPISRSFWESPSLDELAQAQNVRPLSDVRALFGTWPGEEEDGFEEIIDELRHGLAVGDDRL
jgi:hypothetical protein